MPLPEGSQSWPDQILPKLLNSICISLLGRAGVLHIIQLTCDNLVSAVTLISTGVDLWHSSQGTAAEGVRTKRMADMLIFMRQTYR